MSRLSEFESKRVRSRRRKAKTSKLAPTLHRDFKLYFRLSQSILYELKFLSRRKIKLLSAILVDLSLSPLSHLFLR